MHWNAAISNRARRALLAIRTHAVVQTQVREVSHNTGVGGNERRVVRSADCQPTDTPAIDTCSALLSVSMLESVFY